MKTVEQYLKETRGIEMPKGEVNGAWLRKMGCRWSYPAPVAV